MSFISAWRTRQMRYRLLGITCPHCGTCLAGPRLICPVCRHEIGAVARQIFPLVTERQDADRILLSAIIPSYNSASTIRSTLRSLQQQTCARQCEIIAVDSSADGTDQIIAAEFPTVELVHLPEQTDPGTARNLGVGRAHGEIIACIDADCQAAPDWAQRMLDGHRQGHAVVGGAVENGNADSHIAWAGYMGEFREFLPTGVPRLVPHIPTCNISYHRSVFERFGGFPTRFYPQEDMLYHWWLARHGMDIWFDPAIRVRHVHRSEWHAYVAHQRRIGEVTARVLRLIGSEGAFLARSQPLAIAVVPLLPLVKWGRTLRAFWASAPSILRSHPGATILLLAGLYAWAGGFAIGAGTPPLSWLDLGGQACPPD